MAGKMKNVVPVTLTVNLDLEMLATSISSAITEDFRFAFEDDEILSKDQLKSLIKPVVSDLQKQVKAKDGPIYDRLLDALVSKASAR